MSRVSVRAYGRLNDFLGRERRHQPFDHEFTGHPSIKDLIESTGIPHPEIGLILVDGRPVDLSYLVEDADHISVYPPFRSIDLGGLALVRPRTPGAPRFVLDTHLGRLARYLRMLGFDALYENNVDDAALERIASSEDRVLLTQDVGLLKRSSVKHGYFVRSADPRRQLTEIAREFDLLPRATPFQRCLRCNGTLIPVQKSEIEHRLPPRTRALFDDFIQCGDCGTIFWKGSHYDRMRSIIAQLERDLASPGVQAGDP